MSDANAQAEPSMEEILASIRRIISEDDPADGGEAAPEEAAAPERETDSEPEPEAAADSEPEPQTEDDGEVLDLTQKVNPDGSITDLANESTEGEAAPEPETETEAEPGVMDAPAGALPDEPAPEQDPVPDPDVAEDPFDAVAAAFPDEPTPEPEPQPEPQIEASAETSAAGEDAQPDDDSLIAPPVQAAAVGTFTELARAVSSQGDTQVEIGDGRTLEQIVREALRPELKTWLDANLAPLVEQIVREEIKKLVRRAEDQ